MGTPARELYGPVELFHSGTFRAGTEDEADYSDADIRDMVRNFGLLRRGPRPVLTPPAGKGHDTAAAEALFNRDDQPRHGEVVEVWSEPGRVNGRRVLILMGMLGLDPETKGEAVAGQW